MNMIILQIDQLHTVSFGLCGGANLQLQADVLSAKLFKAIKQYSTWDAAHWTLCCWPDACVGATRPDLTLKQTATFGTTLPVTLWTSLQIANLRMSQAILVIGAADSQPSSWLQCYAAAYSKAFAKNRRTRGACDRCILIAPVCMFQSM